MKTEQITAEINKTGQGLIILRLGDFKRKYSGYTMREALDEFKREYINQQEEAPCKH